MEEEKKGESETVDSLATRALQKMWRIEHP